MTGQIIPSGKSSSVPQRPCPQACGFRLHAPDATLALQSRAISTHGAAR